jgi:homopolymeric O-antigen transport system permease protein
MQTIVRSSHGEPTNKKDRPPRPVQIIGSRPTVSAWLKDIWAYRNVLAALWVRDLRGKYKQALLGIGWAIIQPLIQIGLFTLVFRGVAKIDTPVAYPLYLLAALLPFNLFQQVVSQGTPAFVSAQGIVTKVYFPRLYTIIAASAYAVVNGGITLAILVVAMVWFRQSISAQILLALPILVATFLLAIGLAGILGAINARFRDVQHGLPLLMVVLIYASPVLYPIESIPERIRLLALLNPLTGLVDGFRSAMLGLPPYSWALVWVSLAGAVIIFVAGVWLFERTQAKLIDIL